MTWSQRFWAYFLSRQNLVGLALAAFGLLLFATRILRPSPISILVIVALYVLGVVLTPRRSKEDAVAMQQRMTEEQLRGQLDAYARTIRNRVPREIMQKVESIRASIESILPQIVRMNSGDKTYYTIWQTATEYMPTAIDNYLALPTTFATMQPLRDGKTARQILGDQLDLLDREMKAIVIVVAENDTQKLLAHGRFLEEKFRKDDILMQQIVTEAQKVPVVR
jgi:hypothetical protein